MKKNKEIIHLLDFAKLEQGEARYECIQSCYPTASKSTLDITKVTCKNCFRKLNKKLQKEIDEGIEV